MIYEKILDKINKIKNGEISYHEINSIKDELDLLYHSKELNYSKLRELSKLINGINPNNTTIFDNYNTGLQLLLSYYHNDFDETNYDNYDLNMKIERDKIIYISEKIDNNELFKEEDAKEYTYFLHAILNDYNDAYIVNTLNYMIDYIEDNIE